MFLLADVFNQPRFAVWHRGRLMQQLPPGEQLRPRKFDRFFPLEIAWYDSRGEIAMLAEQPTDAMFNSKQDIATLRGQWGDVNATYVAFKGGDNQTNHGHLDIGSFVLDADGVRWALDLGADDYNLPGFFGGQRWRYYRLINHSHNTLVINDQIQNPRAKCPVTSFFSTPARAGAIVDMTNAYNDQATSAKRGIEMVDRRAVHVRDEIEGVTGDVRWTLVTGAEIELSGNKAVLTQNGKTLRAEILVPFGARFEVLPNRPPTLVEKQNEGTQILAIHLTAKPDQPIAISVLLQASSDGKERVVLRPLTLGEWPGS